MRPWVPLGGALRIRVRKRLLAPCWLNLRRAFTYISMPQRMRAFKGAGRHGVGIDIDPALIKQSVANAQAAGVAGSSSFAMRTCSKPTSTMPRW